MAEELLQPQQAPQLQHLTLGRPTSSLKALHSRDPSYVRFKNQTERYVDVYWISFEGERRKYKTLGPTEYFDVNTYVTHPWLFRDAATKAKLVADLQEVFYPQSYRQTLQQSSANIYGPVSIRRHTIYINTPLYSLKDRSTEVVCQHLKTAEEAQQLQLPQTLIHDIQQRYLKN